MKRVEPLLTEENMGDIDDFIKLITATLSKQGKIIDALNANADEVEDLTERVDKLRRDLDQHIAGHDYAENQNSTDDTERTENGHWECDNCGKNWGQWYEGWARGEYKSHYCMTENGGCGVDAVAWHPHPVDDTQELKPCPHCGETLYKESFGFTHQHPTTSKCILRNFVVTFNEITAWNTRPIEDELQERLNEAIYEEKLTSEKIKLLQQTYKNESAELRTEIGRLKKLLESHAPDGHNVTNEQYVNLRREIADLKAENERLTNQRDAILLQARTWAQEAKTQRATVREVGNIVSLPDWGLIAKAIEQKMADLAAANEKIEKVRNRTQSALTEMIGYPGPNIGQQLVLIALRKILAALESEGEKDLEDR